MPSPAQTLALVLEDAELRRRALAARTADVPKFGPVTYYTWHEAPTWVRSQLRDWVGSMQWARDGEKGDGPDGAGAWLDEKVGLSSTGSLFQTFIGIHKAEVVWTGSVIEDDRGVKEQLAGLGYPVNAFFGLFNTRHDLRGHGIGWTGANHIDKHVRMRAASAKKDVRIALFTVNPAAERHYKTLGFQLVGDIYIPAFDAIERAYVKNYRQE